MGEWFKDTKDGDKIALLLLFTGVALLLAGTGAVLLLVFHVSEETKLDRAILAVTALGAQGSGLITAAMGVLRFQSKPNGDNGNTDSAKSKGKTP